MAEPITEAVPVAIAEPIWRARVPGIITPYTDASSVAILLKVPVVPITSNGVGSKFHAPPTTEYFRIIRSARVSSSDQSICIQRFLSRPCPGHPGDEKPAREQRPPQLHSMITYPAAIGCAWRIN